MSTAGSVSKGCFAFKGKKKNARIEDYLPSTKVDGSSRVRHQGFVQMWDEIDTQIQILQSDLNTKIFEDLLQFTGSSHVGLSTEKTSGFVQEIPTAALVTGVNTPDHSVMFGNLISMLQERVTPLVAILKSKDCQNVKGILGRTLSQLLDNPDLAEDDDDEETIRSKHLPLTLSTLATWYRNKYLTGRSSPKKRKLTDGKAASEQETKPPVVVVFEDFESFVPRVVQDFITIASNYISQIPLVFVFGIATSVSAVHRLLPNEVSSLLCMEKFQAPPSTEYLTLVINQILMTPKFPFKLGGKVFQLLLDIFLYHDFSVLNFNKGLRFAMLDHYFSMPVSNLCCPLEDVSGVVKKLNHNGVEKVRMLGSFRSFVEGCDVSIQPKLLLDDIFTKEEIIKLITRLHSYHETFFPVLRCLHTLVTKLPKQPLGKQLREVYGNSLESNIFDKEDYTQAMELLKMMSKDDLQELIWQSTVPLSADCPDELGGVANKLQEYLGRFDTLHEIVEDDDDDDSKDDQPSLPTRTSLHQLRQQLQDISKRKKKLSPYEKLRIEVIDYFDSVFRKYLACPKTLPLHEILYYNSAATIKRHLNSAPRSALQTALSNPQQYLQCECCKNESGQVTSRMPDVCIVYKLHLECGQLINLYDWMQAFVTVVQAEDEENEQGKPDKLLQARFIRAVSELQFLGFVKPTKRKTDHVARLTWGGC